jgi:hypothetical protein
MSRKLLWWSAAPLLIMTVVLSLDVAVAAGESPVIAGEIVQAINRLRSSACGNPADIDADGKIRKTIRRVLGGGVNEYEIISKSGERVVLAPGQVVKFREAGKLSDGKRFPPTPARIQSVYFDEVSRDYHVRLLRLTHDPVEYYEPKVGKSLTEPGRLNFEFVELNSTQNAKEIGELQNSNSAQAEFDLQIELAKQHLASKDVSTELLFPEVRLVKDGGRALGESLGEKSVALADGSVAQFRQGQLYRVVFTDGKVEYAPTASGFAETPSGMELSGGSRVFGRVGEHMVVVRPNKTTLEIPSEIKPIEKDVTAPLRITRTPRPELKTPPPGAKTPTDATSFPKFISIKRLKLESGETIGIDDPFCYVKFYAHDSKGNQILSGVPPRPRWESGQVIKMVSNGNKSVVKIRKVDGQETTMDLLAQKELGLRRSENAKKEIEEQGRVLAKAETHIQTPRPAIVDQAGAAFQEHYERLRSLVQGEWSGLNEGELRRKILDHDLALGPTNWSKAHLKPKAPLAENMEEFGIKVGDTFNKALDVGRPGYFTRLVADNWVEIERLGMKTPQGQFVPVNFSGRPFVAPPTRYKVYVGIAPEEIERSLRPIIMQGEKFRATKIRFSVDPLEIGRKDRFVVDFADPTDAKNFAEEIQKGLRNLGNSTSPPPGAAALGPNVGLGVDRGDGLSKALHRETWSKAWAKALRGCTEFKFECVCKYFLDAQINPLNNMPLELAPMAECK